MKNHLFGLLLIFATPFLLQSQGDVGDPLFLITMVQLEDGAADDYVSLMEAYIDGIKDREGHSFPDWTFMANDNVVYHSEPITKMGDIDVLNATAVKDREFMGDQWPDLMNRWMDAVDNTHDFVIELNTDLAYYPTGDHALDPAEGMHHRWMFFDFDIENYGAVMELAGQMKQMQTENGAAQPNHVYFNAFGGPMGQIIIHQFSRDEADMERRLALDEESMAGDNLNAWRERVQAILGEPSAVRTGTLMPEFSQAHMATKEE